MLQISHEEFVRRGESVRQKLGSEKVDALLVVGDEYNQANVRYLSGYKPMLEYAAVVVPAKGEPSLLAGPECVDYARLVSRIENIRICSDLAIPGEEYPHSEMQTLEEILESFDRQSKIRRLGTVDLDFSAHFLAEKVAKALPESQMVNASHIMNSLRMIKSEEEIKVMRHCYNIAGLGLKVGIRNVAVGKRETDVAAEMAYPMWKEGGAEQMSHCFMVASGERTKPALSFPTDKKIINDGDLVILDVGIVYEGYFSDSAVTVIAGEGTSEKKEALKIAREAKMAAISKVAPGVLGSEVDRAARDLIEAAGLGKYCLYGVAHGVGLQHCEEPKCGPESNLVLQSGMIFSIDVGLFNLPFGGIRMEDGVLVTDSGAEKLTQVE